MPRCRTSLDSTFSLARPRLFPAERNPLSLRPRARESKACKCGTLCDTWYLTSFKPKPDRPDAASSKLCGTAKPASALPVFWERPADRHKMFIGVPIKLLHEAKAHVVTVELKTGELYRGYLIESEDNMNCRIDSCHLTTKEGQTVYMEQVYLRGAQIRFMIVPDMFKNAPMFKRVRELAKGKNQSQLRAKAQRARGTFGSPRPGLQAEEQPAVDAAARPSVASIINCYVQRQHARDPRAARPARRVAPTEHRQTRRGRKGALGSRSEGCSRPTSTASPRLPRSKQACWPTRVGPTHPGAYHEACVFYYLKTRRFEEFEKHYARLQHFYRDLRDLLPQPSREQDHLQAVYILYLLTFNRFAQLTQHPRVPPAPASSAHRETRAQSLLLLHRPRTRPHHRQLHAHPRARAKVAFAVLQPLPRPHLRNHPTRVGASHQDPAVHRELDLAAGRP